MDALQYLNGLKSPSAMAPETLGEIEAILGKEPWFTGAQMLYALSLFRENNPHFAAQLKKAAIYAPDRRILKGLIDRLREQESKETVPAPPESVVPEPEVRDVPVQIPEPVPVPVPMPDPVEMKAEPPAVSETPADQPETTLREQLLAVVHRRLAEISAERGQPAAPVPQPLREEAPLPKRLLSKEELIERFIREEPRISTPKAAFFNPTQSAVRSNVDEEEIVTETLARLYAEQGNPAKAVKIYEKLSLLIPEKSRYFAAQIEKTNLNKQ